MNIKRKKDSSKLFVTVNGRIDTVTAPEFEAGVKSYLDGVTDLTIDFKEVNYVSSAGLRVASDRARSTRSRLSRVFITASRPIVGM